mmetsp:Transcript_24378/g.83340  ORF Transcript_24378/g.83340 Transcript_24378/m.83340 type:complete len:139 (-) Transcript_24378:1325-1741(-)
MPNDFGDADTQAECAHSSFAPVTHVLSRSSLKQILARPTSGEVFEPEVEAALLSVADDFVDEVISASCLLARHRKSDSLEVKDVATHLDVKWGMTIPGFSTEDLQTLKRPLASNDNHSRRLQATRRVLANVTASEHTR